MPPDPAVQLVLDLVNAPGSPKLEELSPPEARELYAGLALLAPNEGAEVAAVVERTIAGEPCHIVTPHGDGPFPVLVWIHGGGWVIGSAALSVATCRDLAAGAGCVVVDVDYRLAPEDPFPAPVDDCVAVTRWVLEHAGELGGDPARVAIGGDSAGGNLSAVVSLEVPGLVHQVLVYPVTDATRSHPSYEENGEGLFLTRDGMAWFVGHYVEAGQETDPRVSPLHADPAVLAAAPPAHVITAEYDPLRDEGEAYAESLRAAGVPVTATRYDGMIHGFFSMTTMLPAGAAAVAEAAALLRQAFGAG